MNGPRLLSPKPRPAASGSLTITSQSGQTHASATGSTSACTALTLSITCHSGGPGHPLSRSACPFCFCVPLPSAHGSEGLCRYGLSICRDWVFLTVACSTAWLPWQHGRTAPVPVQLLFSYETAWRASKIENSWSASLSATWSAVCSRTIVWYVILYISTLSRLLLARYTMTSLLSTAAGAPTDMQDTQEYTSVIIASVLGSVVLARPATLVPLAAFHLAWAVAPSLRGALWAHLQTLAMHRHGSSGLQADTQAGNSGPPDRERLREADNPCPPGSPSRTYTKTPVTSLSVVFAKHLCLI